jgi:hypothetical protein
MGGGRAGSSRSCAARACGRRTWGFGVHYTDDPNRVVVLVSPGRSGLTAKQVLNRLLGATGHAYWTAAIAAAVVLGLASVATTLLGRFRAGLVTG